MRRTALSRPSFLGNRLLEKGVQPQAIILAPRRVSPLIAELWHRHGLRLPQHLYSWFSKRGFRAELSPSRTSISKNCLQARIPIHTVPSVKSERCLEVLSGLEPDVVVYLGGRDIIPRSVLEVPRLGVLGAHWGPLPKYRGMNVTEWALYCGDEPAVSVLWLATAVDMGDIVLQRQLPVHRGDTIETLRARSARLGEVLLVEATLALLDSSATRTPQREIDGRQYFVMDRRLRKVLEHRLACWPWRNP